MFFSHVLRDQKKAKNKTKQNKKKKKKKRERTKRIRQNLCIKHRDSFLMNKFAALSSCAKGQNLSGWF